MTRGHQPRMISGMCEASLFRAGAVPRPLQPNETDLAIARESMRLALHNCEMHKARAYLAAQVMRKGVKQ